jgi:type VI secretion system protein ImpM
MAEAAGWFGKMPSLGDFASRRLPPKWIDAWDAWLQHELVRARSEIGEAEWLDHYLVAPVRRFWLAPQLLSQAAWLGVLMPSVDSVGRHFPFTLAVPLQSGHDALVDALANNSWLDAADALALQALDPDFGVEALEQGVSVLPALHGERRIEAHAGTLLAEQLLAAHPHTRSVWWCDGANRPEQFACDEGLPAAAAFDALWLQ